MVRVLTLLSALVLVVPAQAQGLLSRARRATYGKPRSAARPPLVTPVDPPEDDRPLDTHANTHPASDEPWTLEEIAGLGALAGLAVTSPLWAPAVVLGDDGANGYIPAHPYALPNANYLLPSRDGRRNAEGASPLAPDYLKMWGLRAGVEDGSRFDGVNRLGGRAWFDSSSRLGVTCNWDHFSERLPDGTSDEFVLADLAVTYRIAERDWIQMHAGVGGRGLFDRYRARGGFNFLYSADVFPIEPLVVSAAVEAGHLNEAFTLRLRASAGLQWDRLEVYAGYDWLRIGGVDLHGPMAGLRVWF